MYELTEKELEKYNTNYSFRAACESAFRNGFTKEQMLSELVIHLLNKEKEADDKRLEEIMTRTKHNSLLE